MSNDMYLPALPMIASDFLTSISFVQLTITAWLAGNTAVQLIVGPLTDRYGRRPILFGGGILFLLSTLGAAFAPSITPLIGLRFLQGIGVCTMMVAGYASIHELYDDQKAIHILVWMGSIAVIAPAIGPVIGGLILLFASWRMIFLALFVLGAISLLGLWFVMPESTSLESRKPLNMKTLALSYYKIMANSSFMTSASSFGLLYGAVFGWITISPFILMETLGLSPTQFGFLQIPVFGGYIVGAQLVKHFMRVLGKEKLIFLGLIVSSLAALLLIISSFLAPNHILSFIVPMSLYAISFGFIAAPLNRITLIATTEQKGMAMAIFYLVMSSAGALISLILSIFGETSFFATFVIGLSIFLAFFLNIIRKKQSDIV